MILSFFFNFFTLLSCLFFFSFFFQWDPTYAQYREREIAWVDTRVYAAAVAAAVALSATQAAKIERNKRQARVRAA